MKKILIIIIFLNFIYAYAQEKMPNIINLRGIKIYREEKKLEVIGLVNMQNGLVELLATAPGGKEHESVLVLYCNPSLLQTSLILLGLNHGTGIGKQGDFVDLTGDKVYIYVKWQKNNEEVVKRAEDLIFDKKYNSAMKRSYWVFTGSRFAKQENKNIFMANVTGVIIATFYDPDSILNNPLPERNDDNVYYANQEVLPEKGTKVTVIFSPKIISKYEK